MDPSGHLPNWITGPWEWIGKNWGKSGVIIAGGSILIGIATVGGYILNGIEDVWIGIQNGNNHNRLQKQCKDWGGPKGKWEGTIGRGISDDAIDVIINRPDTRQLRNVGAAAADLLRAIINKS